MAEGQNTAQNLISVTVKSTKDKKTVDIADDAEIKDVSVISRVANIDLLFFVGCWQVVLVN